MPPTEPPPRIAELISSRKIAQTVESIGRQIASDYAGRPLTILGVLSGSLMFVADLMRRIDIPHQLGLLQASSYRGSATRPEELLLNVEFLPPIAGRHVLLVDDILDTGRTLEALIALLTRMDCASVDSAVLLWKRSRTVTAVRPRYVGFEIPDKFVVGYGLDFAGDYRHLPYIGAVQDESPTSVS